jgi:hypothetical protein
MKARNQREKIYLGVAGAVVVSPISRRPLPARTAARPSCC